MGKMKLIIVDGFNQKTNDITICNGVEVFFGTMYSFWKNFQDFLSYHTGVSMTILGECVTRKLFNLFKSTFDGFYLSFETSI